MKTRAAVAVGAGKPLEIMEVDLEGPREGEVLVMEVEDRHAVLINDSVGRDLKALAAHLGLKAAIR